MKKSVDLRIIAWAFLGIFLWSAPAYVFSQSMPASGSVCLGPYLGKVRIEHEFQRLYLRIGESGKIHFDPSQKTRIVLNNLDLHKTYSVKVFFDAKPVESWALNFDKLKSVMVIIWRSAGAWRMEPVEKCE